MAEYKISSIWKDANSVITHYAFHTVTANGATRTTKKGWTLTKYHIGIVGDVFL